MAADRILPLGVACLYQTSLAEIWAKYHDNPQREDGITIREGSTRGINIKADFITLFRASAISATCHARKCSHKISPLEIVVA